MRYLILILILGVFSNTSEAAKCKVNGKWYDYSAPECAVQGAQKPSTPPKTDNSEKKHTLKTHEVFRSDSSEICKEAWTKRGNLDLDMYMHCIREQDEAYEELIDLERYANENFYNTIAFPHCNKEWTRRGITDVKMLVYCLNQEVEGYKDIMYYRQHHDTALVNNLTAKAILDFSSWKMAAYKVKKHFADM